jgi:hypothetical protein
MIAASLAFALTICSTTDRSPMRYKRLLKALDYWTDVENALSGVFRSVGVTFPLLGERPGAVTCLGDNRSTDRFFFRWSNLDLTALSVTNFC